MCIIPRKASNIKSFHCIEAFYKAYGVLYASNVTV